jgi:hypothetical protein
MLLQHLCHAEKAVGKSRSENPAACYLVRAILFRVAAIVILPIQAAPRAFFTLPASRFRPLTIRIAVAEPGALT